MARELVECPFCENRVVYKRTLTAGWILVILVLNVFGLLLFFLSDPVCPICGEH